MSKEAIKAIKDAETRAKEIKAASDAAVKQMLADAERKYADEKRTAEEKATAEAVARINRLRNESEGEIERSRAEAESEAAAIKAAASGRMSAAVELIVNRLGG